MLVPVTEDVVNHEGVAITEAMTKDAFILGRGKLTGITDVHVSRKQVYARFHAPAKGEPYLSLLVVCYFPVSLGPI